MTRAWTKAEAKKVLDQLLAHGCGRSKKVWRKAGLSDTRTLEEVQELEQVLTTLIYRAGGIRKAKSSRSEQATQMIFRADEDIPYEVMVNPTGCVEAGAHAFLAKQEKLAHDQLNPTAKDLAVGAGSQLITPAIRQQLPLCVNKALLCDSHIALLKAEGKVFMKQLQQRAALADLLTAAGSGDATAKSKLSALTTVMKEDRPLWKFPWWGPEDNHALLVYYHRYGVYLYRQNSAALSAWALDLLEASNTRIDYTVWIEFKSSALYDMTCHSPKADKESKATVVYNWDQQKDFKNFLLNQLTDLMEGLTNPAVIQESDRVRALHKKYNEPYMRRPWKEVSSNESRGEACGRDNGTVKRGSDSASRSSEPGAPAHTGPSGHADVLCPSRKRARTDDVQPPQYPSVGQWAPTDIGNLLPQCTADKSAVLQPPAHMTACSVSHAQPAANLPLWLNQVRGVQEQQQQLGGPNPASRLAMPLLAAHAMQLPQQSLAASMAPPGQTELLPLQQQQPHWTPAMLQHQPYQASAVLGQQPLQPCQQQVGGCGIPSLPMHYRQMAQQPAQDMAMQHEWTLAGQQQRVKMLHQQLLATAAALGVAVQEADAAEKLQQQYRSLQRQ